ncbi:Zinc finger CCCH domain-containing protein 5 [Picochlorum sp. SENEW3]|nr:Zinc finger CCCH domain-containing protein 5 [Picochlorum sp. SENEW3]
MVPALTMGGSSYVQPEHDDSYGHPSSPPNTSSGYGSYSGTSPVPVMYGASMMPMYMPPAMIAPRELPPYVSKKKPIQDEADDDDDMNDDTNDDMISNKDDANDSSMQKEKPPQPSSDPRVCQFFVKNGSCAYGSSCKFQHPLELAPPVFYNSFGLPRRSGEPPCKFFLKYRRCAYGHTCRYDHPEIRGLLPHQQFDHQNALWY